MPQHQQSTLSAQNARRSAICTREDEWGEGDCRRVGASAAAAARRAPNATIEGCRGKNNNNSSSISISSNSNSSSDCGGSLDAAPLGHSTPPSPAAGPASRAGTLSSRGGQEPRSRARGTSPGQNRRSWQPSAPARCPPAAACWAALGPRGPPQTARFRGSGRGGLHLASGGSPALRGRPRARARE